MSLNRTEIYIIKTERIGNKLWVKVVFDNGQFWIPALWEQGYIAYAVAKCEEEKYPKLPWSAKIQPRDYIVACLNAKNDKELIELTEKYKLDKYKTGEIRDSFLRLLKMTERNNK